MASWKNDYEHEIDADLQLANRDFDKLKTSHLKHGVREGREKGYEDALQGRDESGFRDGLRQGLQWGELLGEINALATHAEKLEQTESRSKLEELEQAVLKQKEFHFHKDPLYNPSSMGPETAYQTAAPSELMDRYRLELDKILQGINRIDTTKKMSEITI